MIFLAWLPWRILYRGAVLNRQDALLLALNGAFYFGASYNLLQKDYHAWLGLFAVTLAAVHLGLAFLLWRSLPMENRDTRPVLLAIGIALTLHHPGRAHTVLRVSHHHGLGLWKWPRSHGSVRVPIPGA